MKTRENEGIKNKEKEKLNGKMNMKEINVKRDEKMKKQKRKDRIKKKKKTMKM